MIKASHNVETATIVEGKHAGDLNRSPGKPDPE
jgi:hypothetical protein